ncbi:unnamed protein product [Trifolium pratense]|uniref:Uncharacterized protein n=1 Tax=Trifolium pratense TaxID=57577 RepID=A0ACB0KLM4_TRIPR|nr:unnamed protein product [Trifolium pratense]
MFMLGWGAGGEAWVWRRRLRAWEEEMLGECQSLLLTISLQNHVSDRWQWQYDLDDDYTVRGAYQLLTTQDAVTLDATSGLIWHRQVPLKVSICVWRLLRDSTFVALWSLVSSWIGSPLVTAQTLSDHFVRFTVSAGDLRARRSFMQLIWLALFLLLLHIVENQGLVWAPSSSLLFSKGDPESARRMSTDEGYDFAEKVGVGGMTKEEESDSFYNYHSEERKTPISSSDDEQVDGPKQPVFPRFCEVAKFGFLCLELEMLFTNLSSFKTAVKDYTIHLQREIKWVKNDKTRARAKCKQQDCKWEIFCSWSEFCQSFQIKTFVSKHTCNGTGFKNKQANSK